MAEDLPLSFKVQNHYSDRFLHLLTGEEWKVLCYAIRRTLGLKRSRSRISLTQFAYGTFEGGEQKDTGTGLGVSTIEKAVTLLKSFGILIEVSPPINALHKGAEYSVQADMSLVDKEALEEREYRKRKADEDRTSKARKAKEAKKKGEKPPSVPQDPPVPPSVAQSERLLSDRETAFCGTEQPPSVPQNPNKEDSIRQSLGQGKETEEESVTAAQHGPPAAADSPPKSKRVSKYEEAIREVFSYWQTELKHPKAHLDKVRRKLIRERLTEGYPLSDLKLAIDGLKLNPTYNGNRRDDFDTFCKDGKSLEMFMEKANEGNNGTAQTRRTVSRNNSRQNSEPRTPGPGANIAGFGFAAVLEDEAVPDLRDGSGNGLGSDEPGRDSLQVSKDRKIETRAIGYPAQVPMGEPPYPESASGFIGAGESQAKNQNPSKATWADPRDQSKPVRFVFH